MIIFSTTFRTDESFKFSSQNGVKKNFRSRISRQRSIQSCSQLEKFVDKILEEEILREHWRLCYLLNFLNYCLEDKERILLTQLFKSCFSTFVVSILPICSKPSLTVSLTSNYCSSNRECQKKVNSKNVNFKSVSPSQWRHGADIC